MKIRFLVAGFIVAIFSGCSNFHPQLTFPLEPCSDRMLDVALSKLTAKNTSQSETDKLELDKGWVCVTKPGDVGSPFGEELTSADNERIALNSADERMLRNKLEPPFLRTSGGRPNLGIALSGGGTKAAAVGTGVLAGLSDINLLDTADYISSVSGGGYASYFYYAHRLLPQMRPNVDRRQASNEDLYRDCAIVPELETATEGLRARVISAGGCLPQKVTPAVGPILDNRYQAFLRCQQDVFKPGNCALETPSHEIGIQGEVITGTILATVPALVSSTLFDWGNTVSPAALAYRDGIGIAYGSTVTEPYPSVLRRAENSSRYQVPCQFPKRENSSKSDEDSGYALDCVDNTFNPDPLPLTFDELRRGLLEATQAGRPMPFWIMNATAPKRRNVFGWVVPVKDDISNSDMFEMTAVSHGSGRYGYVSAPPSLHQMNVLDGVTASAAFLDANQMAINTMARGAIGVALHLTALDWGQDIANYNTSDSRRFFHRAMPIPFTWLDSLVARSVNDTRPFPEKVDRARSVFIRLMDGGNAENLGAFSLLKRQVKNIVIVDGAQDSKGQFQDICGLLKRIKDAPDGTIAKHLYIPGLRNFETQCVNNTNEVESGYDLHEWPFEVPVLVGCLRADSKDGDSAPCANLRLEKPAENNVNGKSRAEAPLDTRLFIVKPAVKSTIFATQFSGVGAERRLDKCWLRSNPESGIDDKKLLNCDTAGYMATMWKDGVVNCLVFPQNGTATMTVNSNSRLFSAYRELMRQHITLTGDLLKSLFTEGGGTLFESVALQQAEMEFSFTSGTNRCHSSRPNAGMDNFR